MTSHVWQFLVVISFVNQVVSMVPTPCPHVLTVDITKGRKLKDGSILWEDVTFPRDKYYKTKLKHGVVEIRGCICEFRKCFRKCCPHGQSYGVNSTNCEKSDHPFSKNFKVPVHNKTDYIEVDSKHFHIIYNSYCVNGAYMLHPGEYDGDEHWFQHDGTLYQNSTSDIFHNTDQFCLELFERYNMTSALVCFEDDSEPEIKENVYSIGMMISLPFLVVTFLVYAFTPELRNLHGKCLMCYVMSLFVAYIFLIIVQIGKNIISKEFCTLAPLIIYFAFMVSFLWLNVMCIDIWWTFSGRRGFDIRRTEHKRFLIYSAYAWGISILMMSITAIMQFGDMPESVVTPRFGEGRCWFWNKQSTLYYFYGPIMFLIFSNLVLFGWTTFKIYQVKKETERSMRHDSQRHGDESDKQRFKLYLKLFLVFGVNWTMEIISFLAEGPSWTWYITDFCNALYGVFIFFIFVCKANVWKLAKKRYYSLMGRPYMAHSYAPTSDHTRSTTGAGPDSYAMTTETSTT